METNIEEIWTPLSGFDGHLISTHGRIKTILRNKSKIIKTRIDRCGYETTNIRNTEKKKMNVSVHRMVLTSFKPIEEKLHVNHKDGNKQNNHLDNLEWCTSKENRAHAIKTGLVKFKVGEDHHNSKLTDKVVHAIRGMYTGRGKGKISQSKIGKIFGIHQTTVYEILSRQIWGHI